MGAAVVRRARQTARFLGWIELAILVPCRLLAGLGWLAVPLLVFAAVPLVILGTLLLVQAPIFFVLWKLFGSVDDDTGSTDG
jgi:hypothetical protein